METALLLWEQAAGGKSEGNVSVGVVHGEWSDPVSPAWSGAPQTGHAHRPEFPTYLILGLWQQRNWLKRQTSMKTTHMFCFFPFLPWTDSRMDREGKGKQRKCWKGFEGSVPAIGAVVKSSAPYRKRHFHFTKQWAIFRAYLVHFSFEVGGWTDVKLWNEASAVGFISLLCEHFFHFRWLTKGLFSFFSFVLLLSYLAVTDRVSLCWRGGTGKNENRIRVSVSAHMQSMFNGNIMKKDRPTTKIQEKREIPLAIPPNGTTEEEPKQSDFSWLNTTCGGIGNID